MADGVGRRGVALALEWIEVGVAVVGPMGEEKGFLRLCKGLWEVS